MIAMTYSDVRADLRSVLDRVVKDRVPVVITRHKAEAVVMVSLADWNTMEETFYLLSSPTNDQRLRAAIRELDGGMGANPDRPA